MLLHFHLGSQIADIQILKQAVKEITQIYAQLLKRGVPLQYLDVGGGLGSITAPGTRPITRGSTTRSRNTPTPWSIRSRRSATTKRWSHPIIVSESGRAITAHHSVLIVEALGTYART